MRIRRSVGKVIDDLKSEDQTLDILRQYVVLDEERVPPVACCPLHDDSTPSFGTFQHDGVTLCHCFGCDWTGSIIDFVAKIENIPRHDAVRLCLGIVGNEFTPNTKWVEASAEKLKAAPPILPKEQGKEIARYRYYDARGVESFNVVRFEPKRFAIYHFLNVDAHQMLIYNLPMAMRAQRVLLCEGEKDVDSAMPFLTRLNVDAATTNAAGAKNINETHLGWLRDKIVVDCSDNDEAGRQRSAWIEEHARGVVKELHRAILPDGVKDLTNLIEAGRFDDFKVVKVF